MRSRIRQQIAQMVRREVQAALQEALVQAPGGGAAGAAANGQAGQPSQAGMAAAQPAQAGAAAAQSPGMGGAQGAPAATIAGPTAQAPGSLRQAVTRKLRLPARSVGSPQAAAGGQAAPPPPAAQVPGQAGQAGQAVSLGARLMQEMEANLRKLRQVIGQTQTLADKMEAFLRENKPNKD